MPIVDDTDHTLCMQKTTHTDWSEVMNSYEMLLLWFFIIRPVLLLSVLDICLFGLHYTFTWLWSDDDNDEYYDTI